MQIQFAVDKFAIDLENTMSTFEQQGSKYFYYVYLRFCTTVRNILALVFINELQIQYLYATIFDSRSLVEMFLRKIPFSAEPLWCTSVPCPTNCYQLLIYQLNKYVYQY